jgi:hypothetical protein
MLMPRRWQFLCTSATCRRRHATHVGPTLTWHLQYVISVVYTTIQARSISHSTIMNSDHEQQLHDPDSATTTITVLSPCCATCPVQLYCSCRSDEIAQTIITPIIITHTAACHSCATEAFFHLPMLPISCAMCVVLPDLCVT